MDKAPNSVFQRNKTYIPQEYSNKNQIKRGDYGTYGRPPQNTENSRSVGELWLSAKRTYEERAKRGSPDLPTGINWIDELTDGLHRGELWCVSAKTGFGKTALALNIARNIADKDKSVLFISLEMTGEELVSRIFSEFTGFSHTRLRLGDFDEDFVGKDKIFTEFLNTIDIEIVEKGYRFQEILDVLNTHYKEHKPDLVVLDFVQLIDKEGQDDRVAMEEFMRKLAELAKQLKIAIMVVSQLRRLPSGADVNREPDITDMKGCIDGNSIVNGRKIIDIVDSQKIGWVDSYNEKGNKFRKARPSDAFCSGIKDCYVITTETGKQIITSDKTKLFCGKWVKAKHLKRGMRILCQK